MVLFRDLPGSELLTGWEYIDFGSFTTWMLSDTELEHIAKLARITVADNDKERLKKDLSAVLDYVKKLDQADTSGVEPLYQTTGLVNATRSDEPRGEFPMSKKLEKLLLGQALDRKERFVKVKSILSKK